ncbi:MULTISPECIES: DUF3846 domain-containing protein [Micromonospora]|uniref:DUF3846 domain-containing protein n=1 Tax=Micromonospora TaxID=1873 RepID=UPI0033E0C1CB
MTYLVIDPDGALHVRDRPPTLDAINAEVGDGGTDRVPLGVNARGFVNDVGHLAGLPRNVVGSLLLMCCGAAHQPYAGPVVVVGWDRHAWDGVEIRSLPPEVLEALRGLHTDIRTVVDGGVPRNRCDPLWVAQVREAAAFVAVADTPTITIRRGLPT